MKVAKTFAGIAMLAVPMMGMAADEMVAEKCDAPKGTIAVYEPQDELISRLRGFGLASPTQVIRTIIQQSNCFQVIERGLAMQNMMQERQLAQSGMLQANSNMGKNQMATADFIVTPNITFSENNAGGVAAGLLGAFGGNSGRIIGALAGGLKFKQAETSMVMIDARSGIQVAGVQGKAEKTDWAIGGALAGGIGAAGGGYSNTNEGKLIVMSFLDNWNNMVKTIRSNPSLIAARSEASVQNAAASIQADAGAAGDVMMPKIANVLMLKLPKDGSPTLSTLAKTDEVLFLGEEKDGFMKVQTGKGEGWVKKILLKKM
jgi:curli biogenesis system outer membrane secretion channel CsgG